MSNSNESRPTFIYILKDPITGGVRYVGKTVNHLKERLRQHKKEKRQKNYRTHWIQSLVAQGLEPIIELIETVPAGEDWAEREKYWIKWYRDNGYDLVNLTDGGEGCAGCVRSEETKEKLRQINLGKKLSEEHKKKISETEKGKKRKPHSEETKEKLRQVNLGKIQTEETKAKRANSNRGKKRSPEFCEKLGERFSKKIGVFSSDGEILLTYKSLKEACEKVGIARVTLWIWIKEKRTSPSGVYFDYIRD